MMIVRPENPEDSDAIRQVVTKAFGRTDEADLVDALRAHGKALLSLVATDGDRVVGHILFSRVTIEPEPEGVSAAGLAPLAVLPEFQNQGIGSLLTRAGLEECRGADFDCVFVLGHPEYYPRFGFVPASKYKIKSEYPVRDEFFMVIELREGALAGRRGTARYQPEFDEV
ncbi:MAG TPA: N-acetyltransferase [Blastocatellia bacterium]|nr:N-acetyltransferase [Blastocatellia bacterium]